MSKIYVEKFDDNVLRDKRYPNGSKDGIHIVSTPIKPRTRKVRLGSSGSMRTAMSSARYPLRPRASSTW